jgi:hypothetical protein
LRAQARVVRDIGVLHAKPPRNIGVVSCPTSFVNVVELEQ